MLRPVTPTCPNPVCDRAHDGSEPWANRQDLCPSCGQRLAPDEDEGGLGTFVIYDLETTGLDPAADEFIQIAAVRFRNGRVIEGDAFSSFARPRRPIPSFIESYTGISNHHVAGAARPEEVLCRFSQWAGAATLIAHNGLRFDSKFLAATCRRHGRAVREVDCIDSIHLSKMLFGRTRGTGHSLDHVQSRLGIRPTALRRHDARGDVDLLGRAVASMCERLGLDAAMSGVPRHQTHLPTV